MNAVVEDVSHHDPISYIQALGLQPEDSYGFLPINHEDVTPYLYLYRDRPEYEKRRADMPPPTQAMDHFGPVHMDPEQQATMDMDENLLGGSDGGLADIIRSAQDMQQAWGSTGIPGAPPPAGQPAQAPAAADPATLERLSNLLSAGAINEQEFAKLAGKAASAPPSPPESLKEAPPVLGSIAAHRLYPGLRMRSSTRQLNHFLPRYRDMLGLSSEDVYGVLPRQTRLSHSTDGGDNLEWDDFWIVYRDRPEYAAGRESWAREMNKKGKWPDAAISPGVSEAAGAPLGKEKVKVEKDLWPRESLVLRQKGPELGDSLRKKISKWGYEPEDSLGMCPNFPNRSIYFAWRKA